MQRQYIEETPLYALENRRGCKLTVSSNLTPSAILSVADNHGHHHIGLKAPVAQAFLLIIVLPSFTVMRPEPAMKHGLKHGLDRNRGRTMKRSLHRLPAAHLRRLPDANL